MGLADALTWGTPSDMGDTPMDQNTDTPTTADQPQPAPDTGPNPLQADVDKWKALSRKHEQSWQQAQSTISDLQAQLSAKDTDLQARDTELLRYRVGLAQGVPARLIDRLKGSTEAEMVDDAKGLLESIPTPPPARPAAPPPTPVTPDQGGPQEAFAAFVGPALN